jgi:Insertion element 4 transposase N-terminal
MLEAEGGNSGASSSLADAIGIGTLTCLVPRELVDEVVLSLDRKEQRKNKLPARMVVYFVMSLALFYGDGYEEVMRKLAYGLEYLGSLRWEWTMPSPGGLKLFHPAFASRACKTWAGDDLQVHPVPAVFPGVERPVRGDPGTGTMTAASGAMTGQDRRRRGPGLFR